MGYETDLTMNLELREDKKFDDFKNEINAHREYNYCDLDFYLDKDKKTLLIPKYCVKFCEMEYTRQKCFFCKKEMEK